MDELVPMKIKFDGGYGTPYPIMEGDSPFAKRFNYVQQEVWAKTGNYYKPSDVVVEILIEFYNKRYEGI